MKNFTDYFEITKFATPETNVRLKSSDNLPKTKDIVLKRCFDWQDVMHLLIADSILARNNILVTWYIPYKPFARQDRVTNTCHGNETHIFNNLFSGEIFDRRFIFLDVHSKQGEMGGCIHQGTPILYHKPFSEDFHHIVPDAGAKSKIFRESNEVTYCSKTRDTASGKLSGFKVPEIRTSKKELVLIDDICDGGGTFIGIAQQLQRYRNDHTLILYVTHGLFTKGLEELFKYYDRIVTTNSVYEIPILPPNDWFDGNNFKSADGKFEVLNVLTDKFLEFAMA